MRKNIVFIAMVGVVLVLMAGVFALFIYIKDFGANYKGRAKLDYNWKYYFTVCPQSEYLYDGKYFKFAYPKFDPSKPPVESVLSQADGGLISTYHLDLWWYNKTDKSISVELTDYLSAPQGAKLRVPSAGLMKWLTGSDEHPFIYIEKIKLKDGNAAILLSGGGKESGYMPGLTQSSFSAKKCVHVVGIAAGGIVFNTEIRAPLDAPEEYYRETIFGPQYSDTVRPSAENDAMGACALERFLKTFEIKKI